MTELALLVVFPSLMIAAAISDLFTMTIPNRIALLLILGFGALATAFRMPLDMVGANLLAGLFVLAVTFGLFAARWIGGGDAKLAAATALWVGWEHLADYALYAAVMGGALTLAILQLRRWPLPQSLAAQSWIARLHAKDNGVPYGVALAIAGLVLYPETRLWLAAAI